LPRSGGFDDGKVSLDPMKDLFPLFRLVLFFVLMAAARLYAEETNRTVLVVLGAEGESVFGERFLSAATNWQHAAELGKARFVLIGADSETNELAQVRSAISSEPHKSNEEFWIVLIGHGTFDGKEGRFNLRGPDLTSTEMSSLLNSFERPLIIVDSASGSGAFLKALSGPHRVVITATRSGNEQNYARFGEFMALAIADPAADLDKDGQTSLLEGFLSASRKAAEFYASEGRLATEHALIDDNGDSHGTPADWFTGIRVTRKATDGAKADGFRANQIQLVRNQREAALSPEQRARRDELEAQIETLRSRKKEMQEDEYYRDLEKVMLELGSIYGVAGGKE
jgi:mannose-6-phosphate isomerase-like protein (cupin superfamily)